MGRNAHSTIGPSQKADGAPEQWRREDILVQRGNEGQEDSLSAELGSMKRYGMHEVPLSMGASRSWWAVGSRQGWPLFQEFLSSETHPRQQETWVWNCGG